jgi:hypothetical protein
MLAITSSSIAAVWSDANGYLPSKLIKNITHLTADGILQQSPYLSPYDYNGIRCMKELGMSDFGACLFWRPQDNLPTMLVKMSEWKEKSRSGSILSARAEVQISRMVENPLGPGDSFYREFYSGELPASLVNGWIILSDRRMTDFFSFLRKRLGVWPHPVFDFLPQVLNSRQAVYAMDMFICHHCGRFIFYAMVFILSSGFEAGFAGRGNSLFRLLFVPGRGFMFSIGFVQIFETCRYPLYTYSTVIFTMLLSAGGSFARSIL